MLRSLKEITGYTLQETDDVIGTCKDFLFDDGLWVIRYMVADTGSWLSHHKVLITPGSLGEPDWQTERLRVKLTREQIEACPPLDSHAPISREYEISYHEHFEIPFYWMGADFREGMPGMDGVINTVDDLPDIEEEAAVADEPSGEEPGEGRLRSAIEVMNYSVSASDENAGRVDDIIIDDSNWVIRYLAIDTGHVIPDRKVLINTEWIDSVSWEKESVFLDLTHEAVLECPPFDPDEAVNREYEVRLYDYHGRPRYWEKKQP
ncbi:MAG: PRC-barrel domain-containing protein [Gammaproteobacteria bacterium]|nr:PRC-barrel domain-containing protein [Gammaproteobacteria bacterium]